MKKPHISARLYYNMHGQQKGIEIYKEAWKEIVDNGWHPDPVIDVDQYHMLLLKDKSKGEKNIGITAFYENATVPKEAYVMMFYIKPEYRGMGIAKAMFKCFRKKCYNLGFTSAGFGVHNKNFIMNKLMVDMGGTAEYTIYQFNFEEEKQNELF